MLIGCCFLYYATTYDVTLCYIIISIIIIIVLLMIIDSYWRAGSSLRRGWPVVSITNFVARVSTPSLACVFVLSEGEVIRLETLIELRLINSSFSSCCFYILELISNSLSSNSSRQYLNQQYPSPL